jgi:hypothetical protein
MPEKLPVIPLATLLAHSRYVKQSQYTPRPKKKRQRSARSTMHATQKQVAGIQPARAPVPLPGSQQIVPVDKTDGTPQHPQFAPTHPVPLTRQQTFVSVQVDVQIEQWQQQEEAWWQSAGMTPDWPPVPQHQRPYGWYTPPPDVWPYAPQSPPEQPVEWAVFAISIVVGLICSIILGCLFGLLVF